MATGSSTDNDEYRAVERFWPGLVGAWLIASVGFFASIHHDPFLAMIFTAPPLFFGGMFLAAAGVVRLWVRRGRGPAWFVFLARLATLAFAWFGGVGAVNDVLLRQRIRNEYAPIVETLRALPADQRKSAFPGQGMTVADGPVFRVMFVQPGGILDNFTAVVYDPTDEVLKINTLKRDFSDRENPKAKRLRNLITGDMVWAESLGDHWFLCGFT